MSCCPIASWRLRDCCWRILRMFFPGVLIRKIWPKWDSAWYRLGSLLYARCVTGSTKFGALYYSLSTVSNCRFFEIPLKLSNGCKSMDNFSLVDSTQFNCNALLCLLILRSSIAKLFFVRWFYAVRLQSSSSFVDSTQLDCKALFCSRCDKIQEIWRTLLSFEYGFQVSIVT